MTFDVVEVDLSDLHRHVRVIASGKTERNAEAIISMAVMRRGVERSFFTKVEAGSYRDGDEFYRKSSASRRESESMRSLASHHLNTLTTE